MFFIFYEWEKGALNWNAPIVKNKFLFFAIIHIDEFETSFFSFIDYFFTIEQFLGIYILVLLVTSVILNYFLSVSSTMVRILQLILFCVIILCFTYILDIFFYRAGESIFIFHNYFIIDLYSQFSKFFMCFCLLIITVFWFKDYMYYHKYIIWEFPIILLLATFFMLLLVSSFNLFSLFISLEGLSLCLYILTAYDFDRRSSAEAALKYFTLGTLSSGFLLLGIALIYGAVGSLDYFELYILTQELNPQPLLRIGSFLVFFSFIFKLGAWPCHQWIPDVYQGAPTIVTAFFATAVKVTIFLTIVRLFNYIIIEKTLLVIICLMSLLIGILGALKTQKIKRFLAYAAINQMGFLLLGIFVYATEATVLYFIFYILTTLMIFMIILKVQSFTKQATCELTFLSDLKSLGFYNKKISLYFLIILFSMASLPPFLTAITKWYILLIVASANYILLLTTTIILTIFSIYYYIKLVKNIAFEYKDLPIKNNSGIFYFIGKSLENSFLFVLASILIFGSIFFGPAIAMLDNLCFHSTFFIKIKLMYSRIITCFPHLWIFLFSIGLIVFYNFYDNTFEITNLYSNNDYIDTAGWNAASEMKGGNICSFHDNYLYYSSNL